jgi:6-phosphogluconolactonase (cycloisomerase 2 family)
VHLLERDQSTGTLKVLDKVKDGENGVQNLRWLVDGTFSLDSRFVYVIASRSAAVTVFRITDDSKLEFVECTKGEDGCLSGAHGIAIGPKDKYLYVASCVANTLVVLERNAETGKTKLIQVIKDEQAGVHGLAGAFSVACSPDGAFVYTNAGRFDGDSAVCVFKKMSDGTLSLVQEVFGDEEGLVGFVGGNELRVSPDGQNLYAIGTRSNSVVVFRRNVETGKLAHLQTLYDSEVVGKNGSASGIGISPDGEHVYVAGEDDNSILVFKRLTGTRE